ncbi:RAC-alpha serine/threonine-protein kinase [Nowakowskiella sp. JEL0407]|nr:RAC-alpha serine/threonine-protein kinase [Nowakowskiella sp. JEL0407]
MSIPQKQNICDTFDNELDTSKHSILTTNLETEFDTLASDSTAKSDSASIFLDTTKITGRIPKSPTETTICKEDSKGKRKSTAEKLQDGIFKVATNCSSPKAIKRASIHRSESVGGKDNDLSSLGQATPPRRRPVSVCLNIPEIEVVKSIGMDESKAKQNNLSSSNNKKSSMMLGLSTPSAKISSEKLFTELILVGSQGTLNSSQRSAAAQKEDFCATSVVSANGTIPIFVYRQDDSCVYFSVNGNVTINEIRIEAMQRFELAEFVETYALNWMENVGGVTREILLDPNLLISKIISADHYVDSINSLKFRLRTNVPRWNITFIIDIESPSKRNVLVDNLMTAAQTLSILCEMENIDLSTQELYGIWKETAETKDDAGNIIPAAIIPLKSTDNPFVVTDRTSKFFLRKMDTKRSYKLSGMLGVSNPVTMNEIIQKEAEDARGKLIAGKNSKLANMLGLDDEDSPKLDTKSKRLSRLPLNIPILKGNTKELDEKILELIEFDKSPIAVETDVLANSALSDVFDKLKKNTSCDIVPLENKFPLSFHSKEIEDTSSNSFSDLDVHSQDRAKNLADFFGTEQHEIDGVLGKSKEIKSKPKKVTLFNISMSSVSLPITATASFCKDIVLYKLMIKESVKFYGLYEYNQVTKGSFTFTLEIKLLTKFASQAERELYSEDRIYDIMLQWQSNEIFVFKRRSVQLLRSHTMTSSMNSENYAVPVSDLPARRVAKLAGFFGVTGNNSSSLRPIGNFDDHLHPSRRVKRKTDKISKLQNLQVEVVKNSTSEIEELYRMLNFMSEDAATKGQIHLLKQRQIQVDNIYKEGWLAKEERKSWRHCWAYIENGFLKFRHTESRDEAIPSAINQTKPSSLQSPTTQNQRKPSDIDASICKISLDDAVAESLHISVYKRQAFQIMDKNGEKHTFSATTLQEVEDWVNSLKVSSLLLHDKDAPPKKAVVKSMGAMIISTPVTQSKISTTSRITNALSSPKEIDWTVSEYRLENPNNVEVLDTVISGEDEDKTSLRSSTLSISDFEMHKVIGRGKFAKVLLCSQKSTKKVYAIKVINKIESESEFDTSQNESQILRSIRHPFIVGLHCAFQSDDRLYLLLEYVNGGEMYFHVCNFGRFTEERVRFYGAEILLGVQCLHGKGIIYRDLKLENILIAKDGHIKITDFGLSKQETEVENCETVVGTLEYLSPEVFLGVENGFPADWWAFGVVLFEMLCGFHPFYHENREEIKDRILYGLIEFPEEILHESPIAVNLIRELLQRDVKKRLGCQGVEPGMGGYEIQTHEFFQEIDFFKLFRKEISPPFLPELVDDFDVRFFDEQFTEEPALLTPLQSTDEGLGLGGGWDSDEDGMWESEEDKE